MDYLLPSSHEVPQVEIVHQVTPSPLTVFGQKGSGESGYLGGPAAIASAVNDALRPLGVRIDRLPMRPAMISDLIAAGPRQDPVTAAPRQDPVTAAARPNPVLELP